MIHLTEGEREQLQQIQAGDQIAMWTRHPHKRAEWQVTTVERVTPKQVVFEYDRFTLHFWKKDGREVGRSGTWSEDHMIAPLTDRVIEVIAKSEVQFREDEMRAEAMATIRGTTFRTLPLAALLTIAAAIEGATSTA